MKKLVDWKGVENLNKGDLLEDRNGQEWLVTGVSTWETSTPTADLVGVNCISDSDAKTFKKVAYDDEVHDGGVPECEHHWINAPETHRSFCSLCGQPKYPPLEKN